MERQKQNYRIGFPIASIYSAKLRPNRLGPNIQTEFEIIRENINAKTRQQIYVVHQ